MVASLLFSMRTIASLLFFVRTIAQGLIGRSLAAAEKQFGV